MALLELEDGSSFELEDGSPFDLEDGVSTPTLSVTAPGVTHGRSGVASGNFTFSIFNPNPGDTLVTPSSTVAGTWTPATVTLNASTFSATATFTPSATGLATIGATGNNGATAAPTVTYQSDGLAYFISAAGSDSNDGQTTGTPWLTVAKIASYGIYRGATYSFRGGDTFACEFNLNDGISGQTAGDLITLNSYGTGKALLTLTTSTTNSPITVTNCGGIKLDNLKVAGAGDRPSQTTQHVIRFYMTSAAAGLTLYNFTVTNCEIYNGYRGIHQRPDGLTGIMPKLVNVTLTNNLIRNIWDRAICVGFGAAFTGMDYSWVLGLVITGNTIRDIDDPAGSAAQCFGIVFSYADAAVVSNNLLHDFGTVSTGSGGGIFPFGNTRNAVIASNEVYNMFRISGDGIGINLDSGSNGCIVEYNYVHDCDGSGLTCYAYSSAIGRPAHVATWRNNTFRYNVVQDCAKDHFGSFWVLGDDMDGCYVYNNTFVQTASVAGTAMAGYDVAYAATLISNFKFYNNIFYAASNAVPFVSMPAASGSEANTYFSNNVFFPFTGANQVAWFGVNYSTLAAWDTAAATVSANLSSDPQLTAPTTEVIYDNPALIVGLTSVTPTSSGAPVVNAGLNLTQAPYSYTGITRDFKNNTPLIGAAYDIGAVELAAAPSTPAAPVATGGTAQASVVLVAPYNGGSDITGYTVISSPAGGTDTNAGTTTLTHVVTGLTNGTPYTFTFTATNAIGTSSASPASNSVTPAAVPGAPTIGSATAGVESAQISFTAPASNGGAAITQYRAISTPGNFTGVLNQAGSGTIEVNGLTGGTQYTFTVRATNTAGNSSESAASNSVTPTSVPASAAGVATIAGSVLAVSTAVPATFNAAGYAALTYTDIGEITDLGRGYGRAYSTTTRAPIDSPQVTQRKSHYEQPSIDMTMAWDQSNAGQDLLRTAADNDSTLTFKLTVQGGDIRYFTAEVSRFVEDHGSVNDLRQGSVTLLMQRDIVAYPA